MIRQKYYRRQERWRTGKKECYKPGPLTEGKRKIIRGLLQEYNIENATDIQEALKDLLGGTLKAMMEAEMDEHLAMRSLSVLTAMMLGTGIRTSGS